MPVNPFRDQHEEVELPDVDPSLGEAEEAETDTNFTGNPDLPLDPPPAPSALGEPSAAETVEDVQPDSTSPAPEATPADRPWSAPALGAMLPPQLTPARHTATPENAPPVELAVDELVTEEPSQPKVDEPVADTSISVPEVDDATAAQPAEPITPTSPETREPVVASVEPGIAMPTSVPMPPLPAEMEPPETTPRRLLPGQPDLAAEASFEPKLGRINPSQGSSFATPPALSTRPGDERSRGFAGFAGLDELERTTGSDQVLLGPPLARRQNWGLWLGGVACLLALVALLGVVGVIPLLHVHHGQIDHGAVDASSVKPHSLNSKTLSGSISTQGPAGQQGAAGAAGATGLRGRPGARGLPGRPGAAGALSAPRDITRTIAADSGMKTATATCPTGYDVYSGGATLSGSGGYLVSSNVAGSGWSTTAAPLPSVKHPDFGLSVTAVCAKPTHTSKPTAPSSTGKKTGTATTPGIITAPTTPAVKP